MTIAMQSSTAPVRTLVLGSVSDILERLHSQMQGPSACALVKYDIKVKFCYLRFLNILAL